MVFKDTQIKMREILNKLCDQKKVSSQQIDNIITKIIGKASTFNNFKMLAMKVKSQLTSTFVLSKSLHLSSTKAKTCLAQTLITFIAEFKRHIWIPRCDAM